MLLLLHHYQQKDKYVKLGGVCMYMDSSWICPRCGGNTSHFSSARSCLVCDMCGTEVRTDAERNADIEFQRNMVLAKRHLKVGNWEEAKRIVKPYESTKPDEKQVYLYLLVAVTKCFEDLLIDNQAKNAEAIEYWDKLKRLGCINTAMLNYSKRREEKIRAMREELNAKRSAIIIINIIVSMIAFCMTVCCASVSSLFIILSIIGWVYSSKWLQTHKTTDIK